jgi:uncharacterized protein
MVTRFRTFVVALALAAAAGPALAQGDPALEQARDAGLIGEQADGYLGFAKPPSADLKAKVDQVNIKRRAVYTDLAAQRGVSVNDVAAATACELFAKRVDIGEAFRNEAGQWQKREGAAPPPRPSFCGG